MRKANLILDIDFEIEDIIKDFKLLELVLKTLITRFLSIIEYKILERSIEGFNKISITGKLVGEFDDY